MSKLYVLKLEAHSVDPVLLIIILVDLLLEQFAGVFAQDAVLLIVRPLMISGKNVRNKFYKYRPSGTRLSIYNTIPLLFLFIFRIFIILQSPILIKLHFYLSTT